MIDSHCHLADEGFAAELGPVVERAKAAGLERAMVILETDNAAEASQARTLTELWPEVRVSIGIHPHNAHKYAADPEQAARSTRAQIAATPSARAVGEIGLDYHYDYSPPSVQRTVFRAQVKLARELGLPIVVHTREADKDTLDILNAEGKGIVRGVLHCFTGEAALAQAALALGFYISAAGIVTFPKSSALRDTFRHIPLDRLLIETDSPYLAPVPHRGQRNEPAFVGRVADTLASIHGISAVDIARATTENFHALFRP
jgi:TatD DNase family protein